MQSLFFHPRFAWSLLDDLWSSRVLSEDFMYGPFEERLNSLRQRRVISDQTRSMSRQMFVFAENVILPPSLDLSTLIDTDLYRSGAINWGSEEHRGAFCSTEPSSLDLSDDSAATLLPFVEDPDIEPADIRRVLDFWDRSRRFEATAIETLRGEGNFLAVQAMGFRDDVPKGTYEANPYWARLSPRQRAEVLELFKLDPEPERRSLSDLIGITREAHSFVSAMSRLSELGVPTFAKPRPEMLGPTPNMEVQTNPDAQFLVSLYFDNVAVPAPMSALEAMRFRESARIEAWRAKIRAWQVNMASGRASEREILQEIEDANGYLQGARFISTTVGRITPWVTAPLAIATYFVDALPHHAEISALLATHTVLDRVGVAIETSVFGDRPLRADWVVLPPVT